MAKAIAIIQQYFTNGSQKEGQDMTSQLKNQIQIMNQVHCDEVQKLKETFQEQLQEKERQNIKKILSINNEHGRKEQSYKDMI